MSVHSRGSDHWRFSVSTRRRLELVCAGYGSINALIRMWACKPGTFVAPGAVEEETLFTGLISCRTIYNHYHILKDSLNVRVLFHLIQNTSKLSVSNVLLKLIISIIFFALNQMRKVLLVLFDQKSKIGSNIFIFWCKINISQRLQWCL